MTQTDAPPARPFLKWAGGKRRLAPEIVTRIRHNVPRYHEPFLGGGAVYFALMAAGRLERASLSDLNRELVEAYTVVRDEVEPLIARLDVMEREYLGATAEERAALYYARRAEAPEQPLERAARLLFLNRTGYNGLYRVNRKGEFNVPHGRYTNPGICNAANLRAASQSLQTAVIAQGDFEATCEQAQPGDFVYLDPPYQPLSATSRFTSYTREAFGPDEQRRLRDVVARLTRRGVAVLLSNSDHAGIRELYADEGYTFETVSMGRQINSRADRRSAIPELLVSNLERPEVRAAFASKRSITLA